MITEKPIQTVYDALIRFLKFHVLHTRNSPRHITLGMVLGLFIVWTASLSLSATSTPIRAEYIIKLEPNNETLTVQLNLSNLKVGSIIFQIERAYDYGSENLYANSTQNLVARDANGNRLPLKRTQNRQWKADIGDSPCMTLEYQADLSRTLTDDHYHSIVTDEHAYLNGNQIFIYPLEMDNTGITVQIKSPQSWRTVTGWQRQKAVYRPQNFNELSNSLLASGDYRVHPITIDSTEATIATRWTQDSYDEKMVNLIRRILHAHGSLFGFFPAQQLVIICNQFGTGNEQGIGYAGAAVGNGLVLALTGSLPEEIPIGLHHLLSHELFHLWISGSVVDDSVYWFSEGFTDYYTWLMLRRMVLISQEQWYDQLYEKWQLVCGNPERQDLSLREASLSYFDNRAASGLCYNKGLCLAFILDMKIRNCTKNEHSLDDVMQKISQFMTKNYLRYHESDVFSAIDKVVGRSLTDFYRKYVHGRDELPFQYYLQLAGLTIHKYVAKTYVGYGFSFGTRIDAQTPIIILDVINNSPAHQAGLCVNDKLVNIEGESIPNMDAANALLGKNVGGYTRLRSKMGEQFINIAASKQKQSLTLTIQRSNKLYTLKLTAGDVEEVKETIRELSNASEEQRAILSALTSQTSEQ